MNPSHPRPHTRWPLSTGTSERRWMLEKLNSTLGDEAADTDSLFHENVLREARERYGLRKIAPASELPASTERVPPRGVYTGGRECGIKVRLPKWLADLVPSPFSAHVQARACLALGTTVFGVLDRMPYPADTFDMGDTPSLVVWGSDIELRILDQWASEAHVDLQSAVLSAILIGTGVAGATDGVISSPHTAYPKLQIGMMPGRLVAFSRLLSGLVYPEINKSARGDWDGLIYWNRYNQRIRGVIPKLWHVRQVDKYRYATDLHALAAEALDSWGPCGWPSHEIYSGEFNHPGQCISLDRLVALMDHQIDLYRRDYMICHMHVNIRRGDHG